MKTCPHKIDIGAVYGAPPKLQRSMSSVSFVVSYSVLELFLVVPLFFLYDLMTWKCFMVFS